MISSSILVYSQNQQVSSRDAERAAANWINVHYPEYQSRKSVVSLTGKGGHTLLYEIRFDSINVLMSGSKACLPILGYYKGEVSIVNGMDDLPCNIKAFVNTYINEIDSCFANDTVKLYYSEDWDAMLLGTISGTRSSVVVNSLIKTKWNQSWSDDTCDMMAYNYFIPPDTGYNCQHQLVGCNAVAMAQVMNYWQYPVLYAASQQFDWCNMTEMLKKCSDSNYGKHRDAIAYLMYRCALDIHAVFGCTGTTSNLWRTREALVNVYGYSNVASCIERRLYSGDWEALLRYNLDNKCPVIYRGAGHAFVCDGYMDDGSFHFNWGWNGISDSYFYLSSLTPGNHNFTNDQIAIFNITPPNYASICDADLNLEDFYLNNLSLLYDYHPEDIVPWTMTKLTSVSRTSPAAWRTIPTGVSAVYQAHEEVALQDGFEAEYGSEFEAKIEPCDKCDELRKTIADNDVRKRNTDNGDRICRDAIAHTWVAPQSVEGTDLYPNPTEGPLTMVTDGKASLVFVHDAAGRPVGGWRFTVLTDTEVSLDVSPFRSGPYLLTVVTPSGIRTARFLRR